MLAYPTQAPTTTTQTNRKTKKGKTTHKNPVLTPQCAVPLIISGVQKLNMIAIIFEEASAHPAV
ncbi:MAG: hypothetical protein CL912_10030 [Deltaproteobacteria bacterium]|nr:hypothetical protein [Deltaproteobacteria bacterium]